MTPDERDKLLDLHRAAMKADEAYSRGATTARELLAADDAFRSFLFALPVSSHT